ncbi:unnamed protein product [Protopolystoma xenopodis]|uniref:Uncharacterized protein n=1 Tax=Protopolystoma xenopodis TaxID=117903 RepID=A0A3S5ATX8_9PLAT|nr:unnamed protein product [Protopolystoma xenopodis]
MPEKWNNIKKLAVIVKQAVAPLQNNEVSNIRRKCATFDVAQHTFRERFRKISAFLYSCEEPYAAIDEVSDSVDSPVNELDGYQVFKE